MLTSSSTTVSHFTIWNSFLKCEQILVSPIGLFFGMLAKKCSQISVLVTLDQFVRKFWFWQWHSFFKCEQFLVSKMILHLEIFAKKCSQIFGLLTFQPICEQILVSKKVSFLLKKMLTIFFMRAIFWFFKMAYLSLLWFYRHRFGVLIKEHVRKR